MHETEICLTKIFNDYLSGLGNAILGLVGIQAQPRPWVNFVTMQLLVVAIIVVLFAFLRTRLSVDRPGNLQQTFELVYEFVQGQTKDMVGHGGERYLAFFGTLFLFILLSNLIGVIPGFEAPTMYAFATGCAIATFLYYNMAGIQAQGVLGHLKHLVGPVWWLFPLMIPIEIVGNLAKPLSLTLRLFAKHVCGRTDHECVYHPDQTDRSRRVHGVSYFRVLLAGIYFHAADYGLCQRRGDARRALIPAPLCFIAGPPGR